jgi:hypothetical protein
MESQSWRNLRGVEWRPPTAALTVTNLIMGMLLCQQYGLRTAVAVFTTTVVLDTVRIRRRRDTPPKPVELHSRRT